MIYETYVHVPFIVGFAFPPAVALGTVPGSLGEGRLPTKPSQSYVDGLLPIVCHGCGLALMTACGFTLSLEQSHQTQAHNHAAAALAFLDKPNRLFMTSFVTMTSAPSPRLTHPSTTKPALPPSVSRGPGTPADLIKDFRRRGAAGMNIGDTKLHK